jgi:Mg2+ and Co2+ transporter CorA
MDEGKRPFSIHTFMFPFRWENGANVSEMTKIFGKKWIRKPFKLVNNVQYNEFVYFHPFVQESIFDYKENGKVNYLEYSISEDAFFSFRAKRNNNGEKDFDIKLDLKGVSIHLFFTGVGILTFQLENYQDSNVEFIKHINDYGRRTYPQFLGKEGVSSTKSQFLPDNVEVYFNEDLTAKENFEDYTLPIDKAEDAIRLPNYIKDLFPEGIEKIIFPLNDDRMFTICWYGNNILSDKLSKHTKVDNYNYLSSQEWYSLIFCDKKDSTCQSDNMLNEHLKRYTYDRWVNWGTLYGVTRDCLFTLTSDWENLIANRAEFIPVNNQTIYYQIAVICLAQRASINKFSYDLSKIMEAKQSLRTNVLNFQKMYFKFNNQLYFKEITAQIQGIEMYQLMQKAMGIDEDACRLDREIEELHNLVELENSSYINKQMLILTKIATYFIPASTIAAVFALFFNNIGSPFSCNNIGVFLTSIITYIVLILIIKRYINKSNKKK